MARRGEGIYKRKDGRWEARYIDHYENGVAKYRFLYAKTYSEVKAKRQAALRQQPQCSRQRYQKQICFGALAEQWLQQKKGTVKESTYTRYHRYVFSYLLPRIGEMPPNRLDSSLLQELTQKLKESGGTRSGALSGKTVNDIVSIVKAILSFGREQGIASADISLLSRISQKPMQSEKILSEESREKLEKQLWDSKGTTGLGIFFALYAGLRIGEVCGLKWEDIDWNSKTVRIRRTVERIADLESPSEKKTKIIISEPKTKNSERIIPLPSFFLAYLGKYMANPDFFVLSNKAQPVEPHRFYIRYQTFLRKNHIPQYSFHALRHTFATRCVERGFDVKALSEILGHSNVGTTLSLYVHPSIEQKRKQMELLCPEYNS